MSEYPDQIELFEAYLSNELDEAGRRDFESRLASDSQLQKAFQEHQQLRSAIEWANEKESLARMDRIHRLSQNASLDLGSLPTPARKIGLQPAVLSLAALVTGVLLTVTYFLWMRPDNTQNTRLVQDQAPALDAIYGHAGEGVPDANILLSVEILDLVSDRPTRDTAVISLPVFLGDVNQLQLDTLQRTLFIRLQDSGQFNRLQQGAYSAFYYIQPLPGVSLFDLNIGRQSYSLLLEPVQWSQLNPAK